MERTNKQPHANDVPIPFALGLEFSMSATSNALRAEFERSAKPLNFVEVHNLTPHVNKMSQAADDLWHELIKVHDNKLPSLTAAERTTHNLTRGLFDVKKELDDLGFVRSFRASNDWFDYTPNALKNRGVTWLDQAAVADRTLFEKAVSFNHSAADVERRLAEMRPRSGVEIYGGVRDAGIATGINWLSEKFLWHDGGMSERSTAIASGVEALIFADRRFGAVARIVGAVAVHQGFAAWDRTKITLE